MIRPVLNEDDQVKLRQDMAALLEQFAPEDLCDELTEKITTIRGIQCVKHPLVNEMFYTPELNKSLNARLRAKREHLEECMVNAEWFDYIFTYERPWRIDALLEVSELVDDSQWWALVARVWMDSENIREMQEQWNLILHSDRPGREYMMDDDDRAALAALPEMFTVYQGCTVDRDDGWSWTLSRGTAEWFANRFAAMECDEPALLIGTVNKSDVHAYLTDRGEDEIIVDPEHVAVHTMHTPEVPFPDPVKGSRNTTLENQS